MSETGWYIVALLAGGLLMLFLEIVTPTAGTLTILGVVSLLGGVGVAYTVSPLLAFFLGLAVLVGVPLYLKMVVKYLPDTALGRRMILRKAESAGGTGRPESQEIDDLLGREGLAETYLRPTGAIRIDGKRYVASAESGLIPRGATVKVVRTRGMGMVVRQMDAAELPSDTQSPPPTFTPQNPPRDPSELG